LPSVPPLTRDRLDELDERIIEALQENGRLPFLQLARELGVSEATIRNRYQRLCDADVLQVVGVTNPLALGFESSALVGVRVAGSPMDVAKELSGWREASYVVVTAGQFDVLVELICSDRLHLMDVVSRVRQLADVVSTETLVYLALVKQLYNWGVPTRPQPRSLRVAEEDV
jgi:Lrp/AsnC family transcriptional regulator, regulator for asnA, asnC and gidA